MKISNITLRKEKKSIVYSADITFDREKFQTLSVEFDRKWEPFLTADASPLIAMMLIPSMMRGEDIIIKDSTVSRELLNNLAKVQTILNRWNKDFKRIKLQVRAIPDKKKKGEAGAFFTGGVDSFYTYLKAKRQRKPIQNFLFIHGFDIELENTSFYSSVKKGLEKLAKEEKVTLITGKTNAKKIIEQYVEWDWGHGGALFGLALLLRNKITTVSIAGALRHDQLFPYGTHPKLDPLFGTETLSIIHDGNEYDRLDKVMAVVGKSPLALSHLRVCNQNLKGKYNCSTCFKCLWTMMTLECAGALQKSKTFDHEIDLEAVKRMRYTFERNYHLAGIRIIETLAKQHRREDLQEAIKISLERSKNVTFKQRFALKIAEWDKKYNKRRLYQTVFSLNTKQDRGMVFKILARQGIIK